MRARVGLALVGLMVSSQGACSSSKSDGDTSKDGGANGGTPAYDLAADGGVLAPLSQVTIVEMAAFQGTKAQIITTLPIGPEPIMPVPLGQPSPHNASVVALREGQIRLYVDPTNGGNTTWTPHTLSAELDVFDSNGNPLVPPMGSPVHVDEKVISAASTDGDLSSTFNFLMDAQDLPARAQFTVTVRDKTAAAGSDADPTTSAIYPQPGMGANGANYDDLNVKSDGQVGFQYQLVPIQYEVDGSGRLPDETSTILDGIASELMSLFPVDQVTYTIHAAVPWTASDPNQGTIGPDGTGWENVLLAMEALHASDNAPSNVWYVASFQPSDNFNDYCASGCALGQAFIPCIHNPPETGCIAKPRSAAIAGYGLYAADTLPQELAHTMGELHAPCPYPGMYGAAAAGTFENSWPAGLTQNGPLETAFPSYANARIGQWGYNINTRTLIDPTDPVDPSQPSTREFMSYCFAPTYTTWTSDYTFNKLFNSLTTINANATSATSMRAVPRTEKKPYRFVKVGRDGTLRWGIPISLDEAPSGMPYNVAYVAPDGHTMASGPGYFWMLDQGGGAIIVPEGPSGFSELRVDGMDGLKSNHLLAEKK